MDSTEGSGRSLGEVTRGRNGDGRQGGPPAGADDVPVAGGSGGADARVTGRHEKGSGVAARVEYRLGAGEPQGPLVVALRSSGERIIGRPGPAPGRAFQAVVRFRERLLERDDRITQGKGQGGHVVRPLDEPDDHPSRRPVVSGLLFEDGPEKPGQDGSEPSNEASTCSWRVEVCVGERVRPV